MYYQGRMYIVFHAKSHPFTYVYIFPDMHDSGKMAAQSYRRGCSHRKGFASGCCFEPECPNFLYRDDA